MSITDEELKQLEVKNRKILVLRRDGYEAIFRRPTRDEYRKFKADLSNDEVKPYALEYLVTACCLHPDRAAFNAMLDEAPALSDSFGNDLVKWAGLGQAEVVKK